jgi:Protein of unknown function (DUF3102).
LTNEWGKWLVESVSYSQRTANRLMQLFEEYGEKLFVSTADGGSLNSSALTNLTYYQALLLLGIPEEERDRFILQHDFEDMTTRELDQALKERNQTAPEKKQAQVTPTSNNPEDIKIEYLTVKKTDKPRSGPKTAASQAITTEYEEKCATCCQTIADTFYDLLTVLSQLAGLDPVVKEKCSKNASKLAEYMVERLKDWPPVVKTNMTTVETYATHER